MKPAKWNTPLIAVCAALFGAGAASYQATGEWMSSPDAVLPHVGYIAIVATAFGVIGGVASAIFNRSAR
jgi:hypothetical protein